MKQSTGAAPHDTDLNIEFLRLVLADRLIGSRVLLYDQLGSTMDETRALAEQGEPEGIVVIAEEQTSGRGRFNRVWISPRGENLSFSVLLRPTAAQMPYVNMAATIAVARTLAVVTSLAPTIKWPNDVRIRGRKASGILVETAMDADAVDHTVVGIGVNVNFDPSLYPEITSIATSIFTETGARIDRTTVLRRLLEHFDDLYRAVKSGNSLTSEWASLLETLGRTVEVRWMDQILKGRAEAVDQQGNLILSQPDGSTITVVAGEVTL